MYQLNSFIQPHFNGLKALAHVLRWILLPEEYGVSIEYLPGKIQKM
jgi:hypothetical protein